MVVLASTYTVLGIVLFVRQDALGFQPDPEVTPIADALPEGHEIEIMTEDGLALRSWFVAAHGDEPGPAVLVLHGNASNRSHAAPFARHLARAGYAVLVPDYRGYGGNAGQPSEHGLLADARAALNWLRTNGEIDPARIAYFGESLGTAVAVALAVEQPPAALVLRSPFTSIPDVAWDRYPIYPYRLLVRNRFDTLSRISRVDAPVLVAVGARDDLVPPEQSRLVFDRAGRPERYLELDGADHYSPELSTGGRFIEPVLDFLSSHLGNRAGAPA